MTASTRRELRSAATSTSTTAIDLIRALTDARPIKPTSTRCLSARRPNPGRGSTYRRGNSVQTTAATSQSPVIRARAIFPIYAKTTVALVRVACHHASMKIRSKFLRASWQCTWRCKNVGCKSSAFSSHSADRHRSNFHIWHIYIGCSLALGLGLGTGTFPLSNDDHWSVCDAGRVFAHRLKKSLRSQEPHLVHRMVERGSRGDHGGSGPQRSGRARSFGGRCARAHSRCDHTCGVDAARTAEG